MKQRMKGDDCEGLISTNATDDDGRLVAVLDIDDDDAADATRQQVARERKSSADSLETMRAKYAV